MYFRLCYHEIHVVISGRVALQFSLENATKEGDCGKTEVNSPRESHSKGLLRTSCKPLGPSGSCYPTAGSITGVSIRSTFLSPLAIFRPQADQ